MGSDGGASIDPRRDRSARADISIARWLSAGERTNLDPQPHYDFPKQLVSGLRGRLRSKAVHATQPDPFTRQESPKVDMFSVIEEVSHLEEEIATRDETLLPVQADHDWAENVEEMPPFH